MQLLPNPHHRGRDLGLLNLANTLPSLLGPPLAWVFATPHDFVGVMLALAHGEAQQAELARIGRYYATESMLVLDPVSGRYDATLTPSTGRQTLGAFYEALARGEAPLPERGDHSVF